MQSCKEHVKSGVSRAGHRVQHARGCQRIPAHRGQMITMERNQGWPPGEQSAHWLRPWKSRP